MSKRGRPTKYTPEIAETIFERLAQGDSLRRICRDESLPHESTVRQWARNDKDFYTQYATARDIGLDAMADELLDISDDGTNDTYADDEGNERVNTDVIQRSRLRVDTRKWYLSKLAPKRYGDRASLELTGKDGGPVEISDTERAAKIEAILSAAAQRMQQAGSDDV